ncbi:translation release factor eRF1 [Aulographum hederae CBS 113979]|uniref:Protein DOM34 homolog n=1 Tax=Aulographum hederae CBS 113979 TaxID=1176131 RepID=A0A6G1GJ71_9PEZI|nr:translation release factor eRF1 [Aulographum hederae CBS 113979]
MRLIRSAIDRRRGEGSCTLLPSEPEDMWHIYNLVRPGDNLRADTIRKVAKESNAGGETDAGSRKQIQRAHITLTITVKSTDFDPASSKLRVSGQCSVENEYVELGQHHTIELETEKQFTLEKVDGWDSIALDTIREACKPERSAELWAIVMQDGLANICVVTPYQTLVKQKVEVSIPKKRIGGVDQHEKALGKFHGVVLSTMLRHLDLTLTPPPPLLIASPGHYAQGFFKYMQETAKTTSNKPLIAFLPSVVVTHSSTGQVSALNTALNSPAMKNKLRDAKYATESKLMDDFQTGLRLDNGKAWYGPEEVTLAVEKGGVGRGGGVLMVSNSLFRSNDIEERRRWVALVDRVRDVEGGEVRILSSLHESGKRLEGLGGVGAILTFPMPGLDEEIEEAKVAAKVGTETGGEGEGDVGLIIN